jgi:hypothetical protein
MDVGLFNHLNLYYPIKLFFNKALMFPIQLAGSSPVPEVEETSEKPEEEEVDDVAVDCAPPTAKWYNPKTKVRLHYELLKFVHVLTDGSPSDDLIFAPIVVLYEEGPLSFGWDYHVFQDGSP